MGSTSDIIRRLNEHNNGIYKSTKNKGPWKIVYIERKDVTGREKFLKSGSGRK